MFRKIEGRIIRKENNIIFIENETNLLKVNICSDLQIVENTLYKFYIFVYLLVGNKSIENKINFGFETLDEAIGFEKLINIDGVGIKTAQKIIKIGYLQLLDLINKNDAYTISKKYGISSSITNNIMKYFNKLIMSEFSDNEIKKINEAINNLQKLGYSKEISTKVVWNRKNEIINNKFYLVFSLLLQDIKNDRINN